LAKYNVRDRWKSKEHICVEIEPPASEAIGNVSSKGFQFNMHRTCASKKNSAKSLYILRLLAIGNSKSLREITTH
jgi:hypothetical protein